MIGNSRSRREQGGNPSDSGTTKSSGRTRVVGTAGSQRGLTSRMLQTRALPDRVQPSRRSTTMADKARGEHFRAPHKERNPRAANGSLAAQISRTTVRLRKGITYTATAHTAHKRAGSIVL